MTAVYRIKNWGKFQHYKDRNPPWIKLHVGILQSEDWVMLDDAGKLLAIACMVIAARNNGEVPNNPAYIKRVAYLNKTPNLKPLLECGFLKIPLADASDCKQTQADACPETETYRTEEETTPIGVVSAPPLTAVAKIEPVKRATRWPNDAVVPDDWLAWARERRPEVDADLEAEKFANHWPSAKNGVKLDWQKTWRNWILNAKASPDGNRNRKPSDFDIIADVARQLEAAGTH